MTRVSPVLTMLAVGLVVGCGGSQSSPATPVESTAASVPSAAASAAPASAPAPAPDGDGVKADTMKPVDSVADASGMLSFPAPSIANEPTHPTLHMQVAKGTRAHAEPTHVQITGGPHFDFVINVQISSVDDYPDKMKDSIKNLKVVQKDDDAVVYSGTESRKKDDGSGDEEKHGGFHFLVLKGAGSGFQCNGWAKVDLTKKDVDAMVKACQSLSAD
jgi:hypothetical protein